MSVKLLNHKAQPRVVITGMGVITSIGETLSTFQDSLQNGRSGVTRWKNMDNRIYSKIGGDMSDFDVQKHLELVGADYPEQYKTNARKLLRTTPLSARLTTMAALSAYLNAGLHESKIPSERIGHVLGGTNLNVGYIYENVLELIEEPDFIEPLFGLISLDTDVLSVTSELLGIKGPSFTVGGACASSSLALLSGLDILRAGRADVVVASGGAIDLDPTLLQGWALMDALSSQSFNDDPTKASRPFDGLREGFVPSEGSGVVILETLASATARGANIYAELLGASSTSQASRSTRPDKDAQVRVIQHTLDDAQLLPEDVDYINAHATSTPLGDTTEVAALKTVFGDHIYQIPVNATKSMTGHCIMSSAAVELVATLLQMKDEFLHPTINQEEKDPDLDLDFVPNEARQYRMNVAVSNSFGFGGLNSSVVVGRI